MVPQQTQCSSLSPCTPAPLSQATPLKRDGGEHVGHRLSTSTITRVERPHDGSGVVSFGPRPLILGTFRVTSPKLRPASSSTPVPSARPWSYTPPLSPPSPPSWSPVSEKVETLKDQLAAGEALVKLVMEERIDANEGSQRMWRDIEYLREQQVEWKKEKEDLTAKLISRQEEEATLVVSPPSEGVWFAGSDKERRSLPEAPLSTTHLSQNEGNLKTPPAEGISVPKIIVSPPIDSDGYPEPKIKKCSKQCPRPSSGGKTTNVYLSPPEDLHRARPRSRQRGKSISSRPSPTSPTSPWASTPARRALLDALGLHDCPKLPRTHEYGPAGRSHPSNPAGLEHQAARTQAPISNWQPRNAPSGFLNWPASHEPETQPDNLRRFASKTVMIESRGTSRRPSALRKFTSFSSPLEKTGDPKPQKESRLRQLLNKVRSVISRII